MKIQAKNLSQLFVRAGLELSREILADQPISGQEKEIRLIKVKGVDSNSLLYEWLNELLKLAEIENLLAQKIKVQEMSDLELEAEVEMAHSPGLLAIPGSLSSEINILEKNGLFEVKLSFE